MDGGAQTTVAGAQFANIIHELKLRTSPGSSTILTADHTPHPVKLLVELPVAFGGMRKVIKVSFVPTINYFLILGMDFWDVFGVKPSVCVLTEEVKKISVSDDHVLDMNQANQLREVLKNLPFAQEGALSRTHLVTHQINTLNSDPIKQRHYIVSPYIQGEINKEIDRLISLDVITPCPNSAWCNPIIAVKKPNGKIRVCLDARKLNSVTVKDAYPQQKIDRILGRLASTKYLSSIDFSDAFLQVPLSNESQPKTAFAVSGRGFYMYKRMPFGLCNSGATLCRLVDRVIGCDLEPNVFVYLDDVIIATETFDEHLQVLKLLGERIKTAGLTISPDKSKFCATRLSYIGYIVDQNGIRPNPDKVEAMANYVTPTCVRDVRRLLGLAGWYRRFIADFAEKTKPITDLLKKTKAKFVWTAEADNALQNIKTILTSEPILACPDYSKRFIIQCDASEYGIGGILVQGEGNDEKVIAYMSQKLSAAERKYQTTERECLAVIRSIEKFRPYVEGAMFTVVTDHASLLWLTNLKDPTGRVGRWALRLQGYNFELIHRKGKFMVVADALSRAVCSLKVDLNDKWYENLRNRITENPQKFSQFQLENDCVYKYCSKGNLSNGFEPSWKIVVPIAQRNAILYRCHDSPFSAHQGYHKTCNRVKQDYYWPKMDNDIREYVRKCDKCKSSKHSNKIQRTFMGNQRETNRPWQTIQMDYIGPLPRSKRGFCYICVVVDTFSKFVRVCPLRKATAKATMEFLERDVFLLFGVPEALISDNGPQFTSNDFSRFLKNYGVKHWLTSAYHPQANASEAVNKSIGTAIRTYIQDQPNHRNWDEHLNHIACALNTAIHSSSKCSPYFANFGQHMITDQSSHILQKNSTLTRDQNHFSKVRDAITKNLKRSYEISKHKYNLRARPISYSVGDVVWKAVVSQSDALAGTISKFMPKYIKCTVRKKIGTNTYELIDENGTVYKKVSCSDIKV